MVTNLNKMTARFSLVFLRLFSLCLPIFLCSVGISAQSDAYNLKLLTKQDGLLGTVITDIIQDQYGFMWFATGNGLCRYDGYSFRSFYHELDKFNSIPNNRLTCIAQDRKKNFWIGSASGLIHMDYTTEQFSAINLQSENASHTPYISCLFIDRNETIWVGTVGGLYAKKKYSEKFERFYNSQIGAGWVFHDIVEEESGKLWFATDHGLIGYDKKSGNYKTYIHHADKANSLLQTHVRKLLLDSNDNLWVCTRNSGVSCLNSARTAFKNYTRNEKNIPSSISSNSIYDLIEDHNGDIWFGYQGGGVSIYNVSKDNYTHLHHQIDNPKSLAWHVILSLYEDEAGGVWIGTYGAGLNYWHQAYNNFKHLGYQSGQNEGITVESVYSIFDGENDEMWLGGYGIGAINVFHKSTGLAEKIKNRLGFEGHATAIVPDHKYPDSLIWIGIDRNNGRLLYKCDRKKRSVIKSYMFPLGTAVINEIFQNNDSLLWLATNNGFYKLNKATEKMSQYQNQPDSTRALSSNYINSLEYANDSLL